MNVKSQGVHKFINGYRSELWRKSQLNGVWKRRYFVLDKHKLICYEDQTMAKTIVEVIISSDTILYDMPGHSDDRKHLLYFTVAPDEVFYLSADTEVIKEEWLEALSDSRHDGFKLINQPALELAPFYPIVDLCLSYHNETYHANNSNKLRPATVQEAPVVTLNLGHDQSIYSLVMVDLDSVRVDKDAKHQYLHWAIVNIEGTDVTSGLEICHYEGPAPEYNTGMHRYMFLLFAQELDFTPDQFDELDEMFQHRETFSHLELMRRFNLATPVGINGFYSSWDDTCDALHAQLGYLPASLYHSPIQAATVAAERAERARKVLFKDFVMSDVFPPEEVDPEVQIPHGTIVLEILYKGEFVCEDGERILPEHTAEEPEVTYTPHPIEKDGRGEPECGLYSLFLIDPDAPSRIRPDMRENVKWAVLNIPQNHVTEGEYILPYQTPAPAFASGLHRYIFSLYKQKRAFTAGELITHRQFFVKRSGISTYEWVRAQSSVLHKVPVGVEAFLSEWDASVDQVHKALGYLPPPQFQSPSQKRAQLAASAARSQTSMFSPRGGGDVDVIAERLKKIQEAHIEFTSKVTDGSTRLNILDSEEAEKKVRALEDAPGSDDGTSGPVRMNLDAADEAAPSAGVKKVAPRNPVTLSANTKALSPTTSAASGLKISIGEDTNSALVAAALSSSNEPVMEQQTTRQEQSKSATASSQRAEHHSEQKSNFNTSTEARHQRSDGHYSEERTEQTTEEHSESRTENRTEEFSEQVSQSQQSQYFAADVASRHSSYTAAEMLRQEQEKAEVARRLQQEQLQAQQQQAQERQKQELELQESARRAQQEKVLKQQQDALERQKHQEERQREIQMQNAGQPEYRGARKQRKEEFFSAIPDSEYSDTDASSVLSGPPPNRYNYLQSQVSGSSTGPLPSVNAQRASAAVVPPPAPVEADDSRSEVSDTSSRSSLRRREDVAPGLTAKRSPKPHPGDAAARMKQLQDSIIQAKSSTDLCDLFGVATASIFTGEKMKKKMSNDYLSKDSYLWISPRTRSLHWCKNKGDMMDSKYLLLDPSSHAADTASVPKGEQKGMVKRVRVSGPNLLITMESGEFLELKLSSEGSPPAIKRATDWATVIKAFSPSA